MTNPCRQHQQEVKKQQQQQQQQRPRCSLLMLG
jgi:hypothetical protein